MVFTVNTTLFSGIKNLSRVDAPQIVYVIKYGATSSGAIPNQISESWVNVKEAATKAITVVSYAIMPVNILLKILL